MTTTTPRPPAPLLAAALLLLAQGCAAGHAGAAAQVTPARTMDQILAASPAADWRPLDPAQTVQLELATGRVVIELAPAFAPEHVANVRALARGGYFDGLAVVRVQDGFVAQWGDPLAGQPGARPLGGARPALAPEFVRPAAGLGFTPHKDGDLYAPEVGFVDGFPAARDGAAGQAWLAHCYGAVGVGRDDAPGSGSGAELYAVIGHAPRQLDRNVTVVGRVVAGMALLSALPRGVAPAGFYDRPEARTPVRSARLAADLPPAERTSWEALRTDSATFAALVEARRNRRDAWYVRPAGKIDLCNVPLPVREVRAVDAATPR